MEVANKLIGYARKGLFITILIVMPLLGVDIKQHLAKPGKGIGYYVVKTFFKGNNATNERLVSLLKFPDKAKVVEIGFGAGDTMKYALKLAPSNSRFIGYELSESMLKDARENIGASDRVDLSMRDCCAEGLPLGDNEVDVVYHANVIYFVPDPEKFMGETWRVIKPGGQLGMSIVHPKELANETGDSPFKNIYTQEQIKSLCLKVGFSTVTVEEFEDEWTRIRFLVVASK